MKRSHCSNEQLLRYLDGESDASESRSVAEHLSACWACRREASDLESSLARISSVLLDGMPLPPNRIANAQQRFAIQAAEVPTPAVVSAAVSRWMTPVIAGMAAAVLVAAIFLNPSPSPAPGQSKSAISEPELLSTVLARENAAVERLETLEQTFEVEYRRVRPAGEPVTGELRVISDRTQRRFMAQWAPNGAKLQSAVWRPENGRVFRLMAGRSVEAVPDVEGPRLTITDVAISEAASLEESLVSWLLSQKWRAVSLSEDFASFVNDSSAKLRIEKVTAGSGEQEILFSATRRIRDAVVHASFSASANAYEPRLRSVRVERNGRVHELQVRLKQQRVLKNVSLSTRGVFEPPVSSTSRKTGLEPTRDIREAPPRDPLPALVEAYVVAHRSSALLQEQLQISAVEGGIRISGIVASEARKQQLSAAFASVAQLADLRLAITDASTAGRTPGPEEVVTVDTRNGRVPADQYVDDLFEHIPEAERDRHMREYGNRSVLLANRALAQVWALRQIAQQFDAVAMDRLSAMDRSRVEMLVLDHLAALQFHASEMRVHLAPLLAKVGLDEPAPALATEADEWQAAVSRTFSSVMRIHRSVYALFTVDVRGSSTTSGALAELYEVSSSLGAGIDRIRPLVASKR